MTDSANPWVASGERQDRIGPDDHGTWLVSTRDSHHLWEISPTTVLWTRYPGVNARTVFVGGSDPVALTRVDIWPEVGRRAMVWFDDPTGESDDEHWRLSSQVFAIERVEFADHDHAPRPASSSEGTEDDAEQIAEDHAEPWTDG